MRQTLFTLFILISIASQAADLIDRVRIEADKQSGFAPLAVNFLSASELINAQRQWDFGNGYTSERAAPSVVFVDEGTYTVKLRVTNGRLTDSATVVIQVYAPVKQAIPAFGKVTTPNDKQSLAEFSVNESYSADVLVVSQQAFTETPKPVVGFAVEAGGCPGYKVNFTNYTRNAVSYLWNFGDGETSTNARAWHVYKKSGNYDVTLTAYNSQGEASELTLKEVVRVDTLKVDFTIETEEQMSPPYTCKFNSLTNGNAKCIWDFGDGTTCNEHSAVHQYTVPGEYEVRLVAYNKSGCSNSKVLRHKVTAGISAAE